MSPLFKLNSYDFTKGAVVAVLAAVFTYLAAMFNTSDFDLSTLEWVYIGKVALTAFIAYTSKNFITAENGKIGGVI